MKLPNLVTSCILLMIFIAGCSNNLSGLNQGSAKNIPDGLNYEFINMEAWGLDDIPHYDYIFHSKVNTMDTIVIRLSVLPQNHIGIEVGTGSMAINYPASWNMIDTQKALIFLDAVSRGTKKNHYRIEEIIDLKSIISNPNKPVMIIPMFFYNDKKASYLDLIDAATEAHVVGLDDKTGDLLLNVDNRKQIAGVNPTYPLQLHLEESGAKRLYIYYGMNMEIELDNEPYYCDKLLILLDKYLNINQSKLTDPKIKNYLQSFINAILAAKAARDF